MADKEKKEKSKKAKGVVNNYNKIIVKQKPYYYDRETTDAGIQKDFGDMLSGLKTVNMKLTGELKIDKTVKLEIPKKGE